mmetsp:Transcript_15525/g.19553  ORF Transcript_15525/g.19553 Transcript_15525/m.19553 type:complete len:101 (-) Transcript_15525:192-494(-)
MGKDLGKPERGAFSRRFLSLCGKGKRKKMLGRAHRTVVRQLDLVKFIKRQKLQMLTVLATFNAQQKLIIDKMSYLPIAHESDLTSQTSDHDDYDYNDIRL